MKPLRLQLTAFGPYAHSVTVDFRRLVNGGVFLIHGQTGAGKTSILDGICFALYGSSSGDERKGEGMRCQLAPPSTATEAKLEFSLGSEIYRIVRRPEQELARKRGSGTKQEKPFADLFIWAGQTPPANSAEEWQSLDFDLNENDWQPVVTGPLKVFEKILTLLGINDEQFRQVVVLPQGQFRKFLASSSSEREKILETLFRTQRYRLTMDRLASQSKELEESYKSKRLLMDGQLQTLDLKSITELDAKLAELEFEIRTVQTESNDHELEYEQSKKKLSASQTWQKTQLELGNANLKLAELQTFALPISSLEKKLAQNERAAPVLEIHARCLTLHFEIDSTAQLLQTQRVALNAAENENEYLQARKLAIESGKADFEMNERERERLLEQLGLANQRSDLVRKSSALEDEAAQILKNVEAQTKSLAFLKNKIDTLKVELASVTELAANLTAEQARLQTIKIEVDAFTEISQVVNEITVTIARGEKNASLLSAQEVSVVAARRANVELLRDFHHSMAGRLAAELDPDAPCPVCGSFAHPQPATLPARAPDERELEQSQLRLQALETRLQELKQILQHDESTIEVKSMELRRRLKLADLTPLAELVQKIDERRKISAEALVQVRGAIQSAESASQKTKDLQKTLIALEAEQLSQDQFTREQERNLDRVRGQSSSLVPQLEQISLRLPMDRRDPQVIVALGKSIREKIESFKASVEQLQSANEANQLTLGSTRGRVDTLEKELSRQRSRLDAETTARQEGLLAASFAHLEEAQAAKLQSEEKVRYLHEIRQHRESLAVTNAEIKRLGQELEVLAVREPSVVNAHVQELEAKHQELEQSRQMRLSRAGARVQQLSSFRDAKLRLDKLSQEIGEIDSRFAVFGRLSGVASGRPPHNLTGVNFSRFVLSAQLDEVLDQASRRLTIMSQGQFLLRRVLNREDKRSTAGLDLEIEDSLTGMARGAAYLSGGESFLASLALALGLADVVQSYLGGVRLDAVFVDEGFGSLDSDALERAMRTLADLKSGGRIVGIISHVPELKEQIVDRLLVRKSIDGSRVGWES